MHLSFQAGLFSQIVENIFVPKVKSVTKPFLRKGLCIAGSRMLAESSSLRSNGVIWAKVASATIELAQLLATNKIDEKSADAIGAEKVQEAMLRTASGAVGAATAGGDEGYAAKYAQLKHASVRQTDFFPDVGDPRQHLAKQMGSLVQQAGAAVHGLLGAMPHEHQQALRTWCQQAGVQI